MKSVMQQVLGEAWHQLPPGLQAHYLPGTTLDAGHLDIEYPMFMQPVLWALSRIGALVRRRGRAVATQVETSVVGERQYWRRTMCFADGTVQRFDSVWVLGPPGHVVEFVNPWLGLQMQPTVVGQQLHYRGVRFVARLGRWTLGIPESLALGHSTIVERALDDQRFAMDFRLTHPLFGQVFRYSGEFEANSERRGQSDTGRSPPFRTPHGASDGRKQ